MALSIPTTATAAVKAGAKCQKVGVKSVVGAKTFTCIKSGKKLVWNKGVVAKKVTPTQIPKGVTAVLQSIGQFPKSKDASQKVSFNFGPNADKDFSNLVVKAANATMDFFVDFYQDPRPFPIFYGALSDLDWVVQEWTKNGLHEPYREDDVRKRSPNGVIVNYWGSPQGHLTIISPTERLAGIRSPSGDLF